MTAWITNSMEAETDAGSSCLQDAAFDRPFIDKIFEPYYTTREQGSGLGLYIVHEIVKNYGGDVKAYSEPGKGTVIDIYLPKITAS